MTYYITTYNLVIKKLCWKKTNKQMNKHRRRETVPVWIHHCRSLRSLQRLRVEHHHGWRRIHPDTCTHYPTFVSEARTNSSDCSSAYVSFEQVSRMWAPNVTPGKIWSSWLILSRASSIASSLWIPLCALIRPQSWAPSPFWWTGNRPPITRSPSITISFLEVSVL